jgi:hypothetical protein
MVTDTMVSVFEEDQKARDHEIEERERKEKWRDQDERLARSRPTDEWSAAPRQKLIASADTTFVESTPIPTASFIPDPPPNGLVKIAPGPSLRAFRGIQRRYSALRES